MSTYDTGQTHGRPCEYGKKKKDGLCVLQVCLYKCDSIPSLNDFTPTLRNRLIVSILNRGRVTALAHTCYSNKVLLIETKFSPKERTVSYK